MTKTSIPLDASTRRRLARLKRATGQTYDELVRSLLALVPEGDDEGPYTEGFRAGLLGAQLDATAGRLTDHEAVKRRHGLD